MSISRVLLPKPIVHSEFDHSPKIEPRDICLDHGSQVSANRRTAAFGGLAQPPRLDIQLGQNLKSNSA